MSLLFLGIEMISVYPNNCLFCFIPSQVACFVILEQEAGSVEVISSLSGHIPHFYFEVTVFVKKTINGYFIIAPVCCRKGTIVAHGPFSGQAFSRHRGLSKCKNDQQS